MMGKERYSIFSEFYNLIKIAEESEESEEEGGQHTSPESHPEGNVQVSLEPIELSEDAGESAEVATPAPIAEEEKPEINIDLAKVLAKYDPEQFFSSEIDKLYPDLALAALDSLFKEDGGEFEFFRLKRNGVRLYKDYPNSVESFILNKLSFRYYVRWGLIDEFPQYLEVFKTRWRGVPQGYNGVSDFINKGYYLLNPEETIKAVLDKSEDVNYDSNEMWLIEFFNKIPIDFLKENKDSFKEIFNNLFEDNYESLTEIYFERKLYEGLPELFDKAVESIGLYYYFVNSILDIDQDKERIKSKISEAIEKGRSSLIPEKFKTQEVLKAIALKEFSNLSKLEAYLAEHAGDDPLPPDYDEDEPGLSDIRFDHIFNYIRSINGDNFSATDDNYQDSYLDLDGNKKSFSLFISNLIDNFGEEILSISYLLQDMLRHKYTLLHKEKFERLIRIRLKKVLSKEDMKSYRIERYIKIYFENTIFNKKIKHLLEKNHNDLYNLVVSTIIDLRPNIWLKHFSEDSLRWNQDILDSIKKIILEEADLSKGRARSNGHLFRSILSTDKEFTQRNKDFFKDIFKDLYINKTNILRNIKDYFIIGAEYFPEILDEKILISNDSEEKRAVMPFQILVSEEPSLFFDQETMLVGEKESKTMTFPNKDFALNLPEKYPEYIPIALRGMLLDKNHWSSRGSIRNWVHFLINSKQIPNDIRANFIDSSEFKEYIEKQLSLLPFVLSFLDMYPNKFNEEISKAIKESIDNFMKKESFGHNDAPNFANIFFKDTGKSRAYRNLHPNLARTGFASILKKSEESKEVLGYIQDYNIYQDLFDNFMANKDIDFILEIGASLRMRSTYNKGMIKIKNAIDKNPDSIFNTIKEALETNSEDLFNKSLDNQYVNGFLLSVIKRNDSLSDLFYDKLAGYDNDLAFSILFAIQSSYFRDIRLRDYSLGTYNLPEFTGDIDAKLVELFGSGINFSRVKQYYSRNWYSFPVEAYAFLKKLKEKYPESDIYDNFKHSIEEYLADENPLGIIDYGSSESIYNLIDNLCDSSLAMKDAIKERDVKEVSWQALYPDLSRKYKNNQSNLAQVLNKFINSYSKSRDEVNLDFDKKEEAIIKIISVIEDPILYFKAKNDIIDINSMHEQNRRAFFNLMIFDKIDDVKEKNLLKISKSINDYKKLLDLGKHFDSLLTKEEFLNLSKSIIDNNSNEAYEALLERRVGRLSTSEVFKSSFGELRNYAIKIAIKNKDYVFLVFKRLLGEAISLNYLTLDDAIRLFTERTYGGYRYRIEGSTYKLAVESFIRDVNEIDPDNVSYAVDILHENGKYKLEEIINKSKTNMPFLKDSALKVSKKVLLGREGSSDEDIAQSLTCPGIFDDPEVIPIIKDYISSGAIKLEDRYNGLTFRGRYIISFADFITYNKKFYEDNKDSFPKISVNFKMLRDLKSKDIATELITKLENDNFIPGTSPEDWSEINDAINKDGSIKINKSIYQSEQRPSSWWDSQRYTLSQINQRPTQAMYDINKQLIHAGDGVNHTNVGASGFTSAWALFSIQEDGDNDYFCIEQYQSDYPVVLNKIFNAEKNGPNWEGYEYNEYENSLKANQRIKEKHPKEYKDLVSHFNIITAVYPYVVLANSIKVAMTSGFSHIYILKRAPELANIANKEKAEKLYTEIPLQITSESEVINDEDCWKIDATEEVYSKLMSIARELTERDSNYNFGLSPAQNSQERVRDRERRMRAPWAASAEKRERLEEINLSLRKRFPEMIVPDFTNPTDLMRFLNIEVRPQFSKKKFNTEFSPIIRELSILKRSWNRIVGLTKFANICKGKSRFRSIEVIYLQACFSRFL